MKDSFKTKIIVLNTNENNQLISCCRIDSAYGLNLYVLDINEKL